MSLGRFGGRGLRDSQGFLSCLYMLLENGLSVFILQCFWGLPLFTVKCVGMAPPHRKG